MRRRAVPLAPISIVSRDGVVLNRKSNCACGGGCPSCEKQSDNIKVQTKLAISSPGDHYEQEADRVAEQIMSGEEITSPEPNGAQKHIQRMYADSEDEVDAEGNHVQRKSNSGPDPSLPSRTESYVQSLSTGGVPLSQSEKQYFEPRFGQSFNNIRIHRGEAADRAARSINAKAFTLENNIAFADGEYDSSSVSGRKLMAHELAHVLQNRVGGQSAIRRQAGPTTSTLTVPPNVCDPTQTRTIIPAVSTAQQWLRTADTRLTGYIGTIATPARDDRTARSLLRHFDASDATTTRYIQNRIRTIADRLRTDVGAPSPLTVQCHGSSDTSCSGAGAYVQGSLLVFCPSFFNQSQTWQIQAMIHEIAHSLLPGGGPLRITDRAYQADRLYGSLSTGEAITNAESYAMLVQELATGPVGGTAARDTYEDCPTDWRAALFTAVSRGQIWVNHAQVVLHDSRPTFLARWTTQATTFLGGQTPAQLAPAASAYDQADSALDNRLDYECESDTGGRCGTSTTYWYALGDFHVCPSWRALATDDDRAEALLAGLFGYYRIVDDNNRRWNLARLARALAGLFWAAPSAADVSTALAADAAQPQPPAAPPPGPRPPL